eukprot:scaffold12132_cov103-Isochrysis_galbana.AAC.3
MRRRPRPRLANAVGARTAARHSRPPARLCRRWPRGVHPRATRRQRRHPALRGSRSRPSCRGGLRAQSSVRPERLARLPGSTAAEFRLRRRVAIRHATRGERSRNRVRTGGGCAAERRSCALRRLPVAARLRLDCLPANSPPVGGCSAHATGSGLLRLHACDDTPSRSAGAQPRATGPAPGSRLPHPRSLAVYSRSRQAIYSRNRLRAAHPPQLPRVSGGRRGRTAGRWVMPMRPHRWGAKHAPRCCPNLQSRPPPHGLLPRLAED